MGGASPVLGSNICVFGVSSEANGLGMLPNTAAAPATSGGSCVLGGGGGTSNRRPRQLPRIRQRVESEAAAAPVSQTAAPEDG